MYYLPTDFLQINWIVCSSKGQNSADCVPLSDPFTILSSQILNKSILILNMLFLSWVFLQLEGKRGKLLDGISIWNIFLAFRVNSILLLIKKQLLKWQIFYGFIRGTFLFIPAQCLSPPSQWLLLTLLWSFSLLSLDFGGSLPTVDHIRIPLLCKFLWVFGRNPE